MRCVPGGGPWCGAGLPAPLCEHVFVGDAGLADDLDFLLLLSEKDLARFDPPAGTPASRSGLRRNGLPAAIARHS
jgi:hypothetical protein